MGQVRIFQSRKTKQTALFKRKEGKKSSRINNIKLVTTMGKNVLYTIEKVGKIVQSIHLRDISLKG